jgi:dCMP deaminase
MTRPSWDAYFMEITRLVAQRSTCIRRRVGAVLVKDKRILATGYNGAPSGLPHCLDVGCLREKNDIPSGQRHELCRGLHAEQNVIIQAARHGIPIQGATLYCTTRPCVICAKMVINANIAAIYFEEGYADELSDQMLQEDASFVITSRLGCLTPVPERTTTTSGDDDNVLSATGGSPLLNGSRKTLPWWSRGTAGWNPSIETKFWQVSDDRAPNCP